MKYSRKQLNAISKSYAAAKKVKQETFILDKEGTLDNFKVSKYKTMTGYLKANYGVTL